MKNERQSLSIFNKEIKKQKTGGAQIRTIVEI